MKQALEQARQDIADQLPTNSEESDNSTWKIIVTGLSINALYDFVLWLLREIPSITPLLLQYKIYNPLKERSEDSGSSVKERRFQNIITLLSLHSIDSSLEPNPISALLKMNDPELNKILSNIISTKDNLE